MIANESEVRSEERHLILPLSVWGDVFPEKLHDIATPKTHFSSCSSSRECVKQYRRAWSLSLSWRRAETQDYVLAEDAGQPERQPGVSASATSFTSLSRSHEQQGPRPCEPIAGREHIPGSCLHFWRHGANSGDCDVDRDMDTSLMKRDGPSSLRWRTSKPSELQGSNAHDSRGWLGFHSVFDDEIGILSYKKSLSDVKGLYQYLDKMCAKQLFAGYRYINKESDMTLPTSPA